MFNLNKNLKTGSKLLIKNSLSSILIIRFTHTDHSLFDLGCKSFVCFIFIHISHWQCLVLTSICTGSSVETCHILHRFGNFTATFHLSEVVLKLQPTLQYPSPSINVLVPAQGKKCRQLHNWCTRRSKWIEHSSCWTAVIWT